MRFRIHRNAIPLCTLAALILSLFYTLHIARPSLYEAAYQNDFAHYYCSAQLSLTHEHSPYKASLTDCYTAHNFSNSPMIFEATNPPGLIGISLPLLALSPWPAFLVWQFGQVFFLLLCLFFLYKDYSLRAAGTATICLWLLVSHPFWTHLVYAQAQLLLCCLLLVGIKLLTSEGRTQHYLGSILWGLTAGIKLFTAPLLVPLFLIHGKMSALCFLLGALLVQLPLFYLYGSLSPLVAFFQYAYPHISDAAYAFSGISSIPGLSRQLLPISKATAIYAHYSIFCVCWLIILFYWMRSYKEVRRAPYRQALFFAEAIAFCVYCSPVSWVHYLPLLLIPLLLMQKIFSTHGQKGLQLLLVLCALGLCMQNGQGATAPGHLNLSLLTFICTCVLFFVLSRTANCLQKDCSN